MKHISRYLFFIIGLNAFCVWSQNVAPNIIATGDQSYCPGTQINVTTSFNIIDPDDTGIEAFFIQISEGYTFDEDILLLTGNHPNIVRDWDPTQGKLSLFSAIASATMSYTDLIAAVSDVIYSATANTEKVDKIFSFTIGDANFLPTTGHYYEYVPDLGITWTAARAAADARTYFGLKGYLATITSEEEAQLTGEQAAGAGWIGGSDEQTEGVWRWMTGPEAGTIFWNGLANGTTPNYANWNVAEPNQFGNEDYAHITSPNIGNIGSWNDLPNTGDANPSSDYHPQGYIVEYGGTLGDPVLNISASTRITIPQITNTIAPAPICGSGSVTLEATASNGDVAWFDSPIATTPVFTGDVFNTPILNATTSYYAMASVNGCLVGVRTAVTAIINPIPTINSITESTVCENSSATITATASMGTINWYSAPVGGTLLATGSTFTTPILSNTTTYFVDATSNGCTTSARTPVTATVLSTTVPVGNSVQEFCDSEMATLANLVVTGSNIKWYSSITGGTNLDTTTTLNNNTTYYATQTVDGCESISRLSVTVFVYDTVVELPNSEIDILEVCDSMLDGDNTNGFSEFDLTSMETSLLNGSNASDFDFQYYDDSARITAIPTPETFQNSIVNEQSIFVRIVNILNTDCYTDLEFTIRVNTIPEVESTVVFKNCDEDGIPDGFTDFNLHELDNIITNENLNDFTITYHLSTIDAETGNNPLNPLPFNNQTESIIYGRIENNITGCFNVSTISLEVSTTALSPTFIQEIEQCDDDANSDGLYEFDLTSVSQGFIDQFPTGQNLMVRYFISLSDAQLEENEIINPTNYKNQIPFTETLYVRVESEDNGECFGIGPNLVLTAYPRPEFEVDQSDTFCLNGGSTTLNTFNPNGIYSYEWIDSNNNIISTSEFATVSAEDTYTVTATSAEGCLSLPVTFEVVASGVSTITKEAITIEDLSNNNTITIDDSNIGIGDYEFALDNQFGPFKNEAIFRNVFAGAHTIYIRDKNGCGTVAIEVFVMGFPKFFTPNGDGANDTWNIRGLDNEYLQNTTVFIYDRYGKLIKQFKASNEGWNGTFNGQRLSADDFWYVINLVDTTGAVQVFRGHFSLIR